MREKLFKYYEHRCNRLVDVKISLNIYLGFYGDDGSLACSGLKLNVIWQEILLTFYEGFFPEGWFKQ